ncbi:family 78 glycoside hydrolase catalytic domain [Actinoplanes sp. TBRC 11911]|uniref:family 78 glycoside hydrolase catalytic domain n=1 Tax=Actinoplanes sp. TBRC 11911 TaxID=2729386 RepID=UPI00145FC0DD|nr:family 78 glycoside hydrolase catalytic domain [Actinoplanes sp. TBRC 11911]NMO56229.1 family 78 glycoside hydrolase catalytic domain [Actinoplanes sp. TBRC 11911]
MPDIAAPVALRFDHHPGSVLGTASTTPRLSWQVPAAPEGYRQTRYEIEIRRSANPREIPDGEAHQTPSGAAPEIFRVTSGEQILVPWPADPLQPRELASVRVRAGDDHTLSDWSAPATVEAGLLTPADWTARFVSPREIAAWGAPAPILTGTLGPIAAPQRIIHARLYITAHGLYVATLNGTRVGDEQLAPGWTAYQHRLRYQTHDVTDLVTTGTNRLEILLGNGWYRGRLGFQGKSSLYGDRLAALAQLEITLADGTVHTLATDGDWTARESTIVADDLYDGQSTDLRRPHDAPESPVDLLDADLAVLVTPDGPPVRAITTVPAQTITDGTLVDFGQNLVGWVRLKVTGTAGQEITVRHAEVLENGELGTRPLRTAKATDTYVLAGTGETVLEPSLTFHGFRYAEITGAGELRPEDVEAVVVASDLNRTGWFESSNELLNRFHENVLWGMRGNFVDVPTDCPQRDERLGWTGDIQVFSPTASFLFDSAGFLGSWLADLAAEQQKDGSVPYVIPDVIRRPGQATAAWGDAATIVPWVLYQRYGDRDLLNRQLPSMRAWVDKMAALAGDGLLWQGGFQFGDWLDPTAPPQDPFRAKADPDVIATAHLARSAEIVGRAAEITGDDETAQTYKTLASAVRHAFAREYVTDRGRVLGDAATTYALALQWALLPTEAQRRHAGERLADLVRTAGFRISTGFVGTPLMTDALTDAGAPEVAYRLLLQTGCPSWLYPVTMGATTVWERWDSMLPDGSINPGEMTSFNHYALGAVADWLHRRVAGLAPAEPGYRRIEVRPLPDERLTSASARHLTPYGETEVAWEREGGEFRLSVRVPVGATATVHVPGRDPVDAGPGEHHFTAVDAYAQTAELAPDATIRQLMDHEPGWVSIVEAARQAGVAADEAALADRLARYLDAPATDLVDAATGGGFVPGAADLAARLTSLLTPNPR